MSLLEEIENKLHEKFEPTNLEVVNQSHLHKGHAGDNGTGESHFMVNITAGVLSKMGRVEGQRAIYGALQNEMHKIHALTINIKKTQ